MEELEIRRKALHKQQTTLNRMLSAAAPKPQAIDLFLRQHAQLHVAKMAKTESWSFEDQIAEGLADEQMRCIPRNGEHSIAWLLWHMARIEDTAMNLLVAGRPQVFNEGNWRERLKVSVCDTGNAMEDQEIERLCATIDVKALRAYRLAVGRRTREIVKALEPDDLRNKVDPRRLEQVLAEGAVVEAARGVIDYWGRRTIAGLLLMPATRHNIIHLNEALRIKLNAKKGLRVSRSIAGIRVARGT